MKSSSRVHLGTSGPEDWTLQGIWAWSNLGPILEANHKGKPVKDWLAGLQKSRETEHPSRSAKARDSTIRDQK